MANGIHISQKSKVGNHKQKTEQKSLDIKAARYVQDFKIAIVFSNRETKLVDFLLLFQKYVKGNNLKYFSLRNFKKFIVANGNIYWGRNEDVIFPVQVLYDGSYWDNSKEEIVYII